MKEVVPSERGELRDQGGADAVRRVSVRLIEIHGSRTALKVYLTIALGVFVSILILAIHPPHPDRLVVEILIGWAIACVAFILGAWWAGGQRDAYIEELEEICRKLWRNLNAD